VKHNGMTIPRALFHLLVYLVILRFVEQRCSMNWQGYRKKLAVSKLEVLSGLLIRGSEEN